MEELTKLAEKLIRTAGEKNMTLATAESCTGGLVSAAITSVSGASQVFDRGFVTYSYEAKSEVLKVSSSVLENYGAVSKEVVEEMAVGAIINSHANLSVAITGVAGPTGGTPEKPVGLVYFGYFDKAKNKIKSEKQQYEGDRTQIRLKASKRALELFAIMLNEH